ncbi:MAG: hypothetical protein FWF50_07885 [Defluviitaleaceae bacterium]|nr:hypothetical protein [Defluviitaleaceae bacterium]
MSFKSFILSVILAVSGVYFLYEYSTTASEETFISPYIVRERKVIEQLFFDKFSLLDENISEEFIYNFDAPINLFWKYNREFIRDDISEQRRAELEASFPRINTVSLFLTDEYPIYGFMGDIISLDDFNSVSFPVLFPASFSNSRLFISQLINHHNLNSNPEYNLNLKEQWSYGAVRYVRKNSSPFLILARDSISTRDLLVTLDENTKISIVRSMAVPSISFQIESFFENYGLLHEVIILDGNFEGRRGFIPHYYLR